MKCLSYPILARLMYAALWLLALPMLLTFMLLRSIRQPAYRAHLSERLGAYPAPGAAPIWLHAASLGEVQAVAALLLELAESDPKAHFLISCQTPAGRLAAQALPIARMQVVYLPLDCAVFVRRFLGHFKPRMALMVETEIWPNLYLGIKNAGVPLLLINARLSERSRMRYETLGGVFAAALALPEAILCQSSEDAERFVSAGARRATVSVACNLKWQNTLSDSARTAALARRATWPQTPVWLAASTHPDEEPLMLAMHRAVLALMPDALLLWAPRHSERFGFAIKAARNAGLCVQTRTQHTEPTPEARVFVIDSLGELVSFMPGLDAVFIGGTLQAIGGHNVLEPASAGVPVLVGPHTAHFADSVALLAQAGGLLQCATAIDMQNALLALLQNPTQQQRMADANTACVAANGGALEKTKALIMQYLG